MACHFCCVARIFDVRKAYINPKYTKETGENFQLFSIPRIANNGNLNKDINSNVLIRTFNWMLVNSLSTLRVFKLPIHKHIRLNYSGALIKLKSGISRTVALGCDPFHSGKIRKCLGNKIMLPRVPLKHLWFIRDKTVPDHTDGECNDKVKQYLLSL